MCTLADFNTWVDDLCNYARRNSCQDEFVEVVRSEGSGSEGSGYECLREVRIYSDNYRYTIRAVERSNDKGYLGCFMTCRKPRAGEHHFRGADLPDGPLTKETWDSIRNAIIGRELVKLAPLPQPCIADTVSDAPPKEDSGA